MLRPCRDLLDCRKGGLWTVSLPVPHCQHVTRMHSQRPEMASPEASESAGSRKRLQTQSPLKLGGKRHVGCVPGASKEAGPERELLRHFSPSAQALPGSSLLESRNELLGGLLPTVEVPLSQTTTGNPAPRSSSPSLVSKHRSKVPKAGVAGWGEG